MISRTTNKFQDWQRALRSSLTASDIDIGNTDMIALKTHSVMPGPIIQRAAFSLTMPSRPNGSHGTVLRTRRAAKCGGWGGTYINGRFSFSVFCYDRLADALAYAGAATQLNPHNGKRPDDLSEAGLPAAPTGASPRGY
jgi:hypothetical protein